MVAIALFFIENKPVYASGKGDVFFEVKINLSNYHVVVVYPNLHSNTALAYKGVIPTKPKKTFKQLLPKIFLRGKIINKRF